MAASSNLHEFNDQNFDTEISQSTVPVLVDFTATWCGPCRMLAPIVEKLADELAGKVRVAKVDIDNAPETAAKYGIRGVPTVMVFKEGKPVGQHVGLLNREALVKLIGV